jgi:hypothetical protein
VDDEWHAKLGEQQGDRGDIAIEKIGVEDGCRDRMTLNQNEGFLDGKRRRNPALRWQG